jgi:hypothetical protein
MKLDQILNNKNIAIRRDRETNTLILAIRDTRGKIVLRHIQLRSLERGDERDEPGMIKHFTEVRDWESYGHQLWWEVSVQERARMLEKWQNEEDKQSQLVSSSP